MGYWQENSTSTGMPLALILDIMGQKNKIEDILSEWPLSVTTVVIKKSHYQWILNYVIYKWFVWDKSLNLIKVFTSQVFFFVYLFNLIFCNNTPSSQIKMLGIIFFKNCGYCFKTEIGKLSSNSDQGCCIHSVLFFLRKSWIHIFYYLWINRWLDSFALVKQPVKEKEKSKFETR